MHQRSIAWNRAALRVQFTFLLFAHFCRKAGFNPDQPRDEQGRWTDAGSDGESHDSLDQALTTAADQTPRSDMSRLQEIANSPVIRSQIDMAWNASNPASAAPQENGFWISKDKVTGEIFTRPFANPGLAARIIPGPVPDDAIAFFHTHPNKGDFTPGPSIGDKNFAAQTDLPGLIQSHNGMYYFGPLLKSGR